jgi:hypothetical protein
MAMGLGLLGRGDTRGAVRLWSLHVLGAAIAGAVLGGLLGSIGVLVGLSAWRMWLIALVALIALVVGLMPGPLRLGRQRQVPRRWSRTMEPARLYLLWGMLLGCGVATPILNSAFLLLLGSQLTAGVALGAVSGAIFGGVREMTALVPVLRRFDLDHTMNLLETMRPLARRLNIAFVVLGGIVLVWVSR